MIDEDDLRRLLAEAADAVPPPGRAPEALLASLERPPAAPAPARPRGRVVVAVAAALVVMVIGATVLAGNESRDDASRTAFDRGGAVPTSVPKTREEAQAEAGGGGTDGLGLAQQPPLADSAKIIRTGSLDLEVRRGGFEAAIERVTAKATGLGGYVAESTTSEAGEVPSGSIVLRVPSDDYNTLLSDLRRLGEVKAVSSKGTDVSARFTDLAARLKALSATRDRLSAVLSQAANVGDILAVQDRITTVQVEIEQIQGQQRLLEDQMSFATLAVTLAEPGAETAADPETDGGLGQAWKDARRRFGNGIEGIVSWSGPAALIIVVGLILFVVIRLTWVTLRRRAV